MQDSSGCNKGSFRHTAPPRSWTPPCCLQLGPSERTRHCTRRNFQQMDKQTDKQSANRQCSAPRAHMRGSASTILRLDKHAKPPQIWHDFSLLPFCLLIISPLPLPPLPWAGCSNATGVCSYRTVLGQLLLSYCRLPEIPSLGMNSTAKVRLLATAESVRSHNTGCKTWN